MSRFRRLVVPVLILALVPAAAAGQTTPTPTAETVDPCPVVVTFHWDVTALDSLTGIRWELKDAPFTEPNGPDNGRIASDKVNETIGSVEIDLRDYGPVFTGTYYYFRVIGRGNGGALPSEAVEVDPPPLGVDVQASSPGPLEARADYTLHPWIQACGDRVRRELAGADGTVLDAQESATLTGPATFTVPAPGAYEIRVAVLGAADHAVGAPGSDAVEVGDAQPPVALTVTVRDLAGTTCDPGARAGFATVTATRRDGTGDVGDTAQTDADGVATLALPPGGWEVVASRTGCGDSEPVPWDSTDPPAVTVDLPDCQQEPPDLALAVDLAPKMDLPVEVPVSVVNEGAGPAPAGQIAVERTAVGRTPASLSRRAPARKPASIAVGSAALPALCPGESAEAVLPDPGVRPGTWAYLVTVPGERVSVQVDVLAPPEPEPVVDLALTAEQSASTLAGGETMTYTVSLSNAGAVDLADLVVRNHVSTNLDLEGATGSHGFQCEALDANLLGREVLCQGGAVAAGETATITIAASLPTSANAGHDLQFVSRADPDEVVDEVDEGNNHRILHATTTAMETAVYPVTDVLGLVDYAEERGYSIQIVVQADRGLAPTPTEACTRSTLGDWLAMTADGGTFSIGLTCEYRIFTADPLADGWRISRIEVELAKPIERVPDPGSCEGRILPSGGIRVRLRKPPGAVPAPGPLSPGRRNTCYLTRVELTGPADGEWRDAFD